MKKRILGIFASLLIVVLIVLPVYVGYATKPTIINGIIYVLGPYEGTTRQAGNSNNIIRLGVGTQYWEGDITGYCTHELRWVTHKSGTEDQTVNGHNIYTFEATVLGKSGILIIVGEFDQWRIIDGTGDLANVHGHGTWEYIADIRYSYTGQVHFDP